MSWLAGILASFLIASGSLWVSVQDYFAVFTAQDMREGVTRVSNPGTVVEADRDIVLPEAPAPVRADELPEADLPAPESIPPLAEETVQDTAVAASPPLALPTRTPEPALEALYGDGMFGYTNAERYRRSLPILRRNPVLDRIAEAKVDDMFARQYFAHESPSGDNVGALAKRFGYAYLTVGENLASGSFRDNKHVVTAWMDSPGHRANILSDRYQEIGLAAKKGDYKGNEVWMAVQIFGLSRTVCPAPNDADLAHIEELKEMLIDLLADVEARAEVVHSTPRSSARYEERFEAYRYAVENYNTWVTELTALVDTYNASVANFNTCTRRYTSD